MTAPVEWLEPPLREQLSSAEIAEGRGEWEIARAVYEELLHRLHPNSEASVVALLIRRIARSHLEEARFDAAVDCAALAARVSNEGGDAAGEAHASNLLAIVHHQRGEIQEAEALYRRARAQAEVASAGALVAMLDQNLGNLACLRGDHALARRQYESSLCGYRELGLERPQGPLLNNLGMLYTDLGDWRTAEEYFAQATSSAIEANDVPGRVRTLANRVDLYIRQRRYRKARQLCRRLLAQRGRVFDGAWIGETYKYLGIVARETDAVAEAERHFAAALRVADERQDMLLRAEVRRELSILYHLTGRNQETLEQLNRAHALFTQLTARGALSDLDRRLERLEAQFLVVVRRWGSSIESKDRYTQGHCERVADLACDLARDAGFDERVLLWFRMGALLHDVGKVMIPDHVLVKAGPLTESERATMRLHPTMGEALLAGTQFPWDVRPMVRHHHERWDGSGYPDGLRGESIPIAARLLCIADVFDALTSSRSYRPAYDPTQAVHIMRLESGTTFDPELLSIFLQHTLPNRMFNGAPPLADEMKLSA